MKIKIKIKIEIYHAISPIEIVVFELLCQTLYLKKGFFNCSYFSLKTFRLFRLHLLFLYLSINLNLVLYLDLDLNLDLDLDLDLDLSLHLAIHISSPRPL